MENYIDGFVLPIPRKHIDQYRQVAEKVAQVWKSYGALAYHECVADDLHLEGTGSFPKMVGASEDEAIIFGWVVFESKAARDDANKKVPNDPRMTALIAPLTDPNDLIFDGRRMAYAGFKPLVQSI